MKRIPRRMPASLRVPVNAGDTLIYGRACTLWLSPANDARTGGYGLCAIESEAYR